MRSQTHKQKILYHLNEAGGEGIHSFWLNRKVTWKAATRISELKRDGYDIESKPEKKGTGLGVRYTLRKS